MKPILEIRNIWKKYKVDGQQQRYLSLREKLKNPFKFAPEKETFWALKGITFDVFPGECIGIIGKNGAGKSTLLKILSKITPPTRGFIKSRGRIASLLEVGTGFHSELTGRENIYLNGSILGLRRSEINQKFDEIVDFSGVERFLDTPLKHFSSGMQLRLAFAVAAHLEPEILLIDEVLAVGDAEFKKKCIGKMDEVSKDSRTIIFVSHDMALISKLCQKTIVLQKGVVDFTGKTAHAISYYSLLNNENAASELKERTDRKGTGIFKFTRLQIKNAENQAVSSVLMGEEIIISLFFESHSESQAKNVNIFIGLYDVFNTCIIAFNNEIVTGTGFKNLPSSGEIQCIIPKINLMPGIYDIAVNGQANEIESDVILNAGTLTVESGDFFGSGKIYPNPKARTLIPHTWKIHEI